MTGDGSSSRRRPSAAGVAVSVTALGARPALGRARVAALAEAALRAEGARSAEVSIALVDAERMAALNWRHLRHRGPTDVITFALAGVPGAPLTGDVYVCPEVVSANARAHGVGAREELARVIVHAMLHVLGHEHPEDEGRTRSPMWRRQEALVARLLPGLLTPVRAAPSARAARARSRA
jgi:probable rRNA maturation factor